MTTIGIFTEKNGGYAGSINTLTLKTDLLFLPVNKSSPKSPDYELIVPDTGFQVGVAWNRKSQKGNPWTSVILDDPSFVTPISARLIQDEGGHYLLYWNR